MRAAGNAMNPKRYTNREGEATCEVWGAGRDRWSPSRAGSHFAFVSSVQGLAFEIFAQGFVHRARAVSLEVERDVRKAELLQMAYHRVAEFRVKEAGDFFGADLDAGGSLIVEADSEESESAVTQKCLGTVDAGEVFAGNAGAVGETGGEAGECGLVPRGKVEVLRQLAYVHLAQVGF